MDLPILTSSRLKAARACARLHKIQYIDGYRPVEEAGVLRFGSLVHGGLEAWWDAPKGERLDAALAAIMKSADEADAFDLVRVEVMLRGYDARWSDQDLQVIGVEVEFRAPLINPESDAPSRTWQLGGKIDAIAVTPDNRTFIVEHKTTSEDIAPGSEYWRRLRMDGQVSVYFEGAAALGLKVDGCVYDVLRKPSLRPKKKAAEVKLKKDGTPYANQQIEDETPSEFHARLLEAVAENPSAYYARGEVVRLEAEMEEARFDIWQLGRTLRESELAGRHPRNPDACVRYGRLCPFFGACAGEASLDDSTLFRRSENVHPELSEVAAPAA